MGKLDPRLDKIFAPALDIADANDRAAFVERACGGDETLRQEVEALLQASQGAGDFMNATRLAGPVNSIPSQQAGDRIGRYKLLEQIGEGGCGVVYVAEQEEPIRRRVALKVIKLGMDTKSVVARFEAERQALALMDHPNIARVFDAGATEAGRPFFVMEMVRGIRITDYCDQNQLSTRERLDLFTQVCHAVQHAHQKGIIHRDLKPSNILVTLHDGVPVPKVIDFGIAKATSQQRLTDKTVYTAFAQFIGTPAYMSPEQAEMSGLDVDTRSDIYSLGVLLYELLTGKPPFEAETLAKAGLDEMRRILREEEPSRPSAWLSTLADADLTTVANTRRAEPSRLVHLVRGDLDWIVMKSLEKDRTRRYETANAMAQDVQRHLNQEPVTAAAPSAYYLMGKFVSRHRAALSTAAALLLLLVAGTIVSAWQAVRATRAERAQSLLREQAEQARANEMKLRLQAEAREKIAQAGFLARNGDPDGAERIINTVPPFLARMDSEGTAAIYSLLGRWRAGQGRWREAVSNYTQVVAAQPTNFEGYHWLVPALVQSGDRQGYEEIRRQMLARFGETTNPVVAERLVKDCLVLPWSGPEVAALTHIASASLKAGSNHWAWSSIQFTKALAEYRAGHFASTVEWLHGPLRQQEQNLCRDVDAYMVLAMAQHRMNAPGYARDALSAGFGIAARLPSSEHDLKDWTAWNDWVIAQTLMREAKQQIEGPADSTGPSR